MGTLDATDSRAARRRPALGVIVLVAAIAVVASLGHRSQARDRNVGLAQALVRQGLIVDTHTVLWLDTPPFGLLHSVAGSVPVVVRAAPGEEEPHDIYLLSATLSPEGVLLSVGRAHNLTETSAVDEQRPVGHSGRFAFVEQPMLGDEAPSSFRFVDLAGNNDVTKTWSRFERLQATITRLQQTGRADGIARIAFSVQPEPSALTVSIEAGHLRVDADANSATISLDNPLEVPSWLSAEPAAQSRPPRLVNWAVDRVRAEIGSEAMQYIKAIFYSAKDIVMSNTEAFGDDSAATEIAADLGEESLEVVERAIPVDPAIGFPPPPLQIWVASPVLKGEGIWQPKDKDPFIHQLPGLPPTFVTTFIRGDRRRKVTRVYIALWDPRLVQLNMMAGVAEPKSATGATGPGMIPREPKVLRKVAAAMNAGFQALHGEYGMMSDGVIYLPPKPYGATVAKMRDGSTAFGTWPMSPAIPSDMLSYRQNMTPIVVDEKFNPYGRTWWGGTPADWEDKTHTVRTGICMTKEGFIGYFYGAELSPKALGQAMIQTRCQYGVALDMNAGHSGLEFYKVAPDDEMPKLDRHLRKYERVGKVPKIEGWSFRARRLISGMGLMYFPRYIKREGRDFFYLTLRDVLPGEKLGNDEWQVKGLPQHGFPYALAQTNVTLPSGATARVLKLDPRMITVGEGDADGDVVALLNPRAPETEHAALWLTPNALSISDEPAVIPAAMLASGPSLTGAGEVSAAVAVEQSSGMGIYIEILDGKAPAEELAALITRLGAVGGLAVEPLDIALGGDTSIAGEGVRLEENPAQLRLIRKPGAGTERIFEGTPVVPMKEWYPLQARRIRYFKKRKKKDS